VVVSRTRLLITRLFVGQVPRASGDDFQSRNDVSSTDLRPKEGDLVAKIEEFIPKSQQKCLI